MYVEKIFHQEGNAPSDDEIREYLQSSICPLHNFIGNENAKDKLCSIGFTAWKNSNHAVMNYSNGKPKKTNIAFIGNAGLGKTTLAKLFSKTLLLPFIELSKIVDVQEIFDAIQLKLKEQGLSLNLIGDKFMCPAVVVFMDEVHRYKGKSRKSPSGIMNDLLKATEPNDSILTKQGKWTLDCTNICWIAATTDWFQLPKPFRSRFETIEIVPYTSEEVTDIVLLEFPKLPKEIARVAAEYGHNVPRLALAFANSFSLEKEYRNVSWKEAAAMVAEQKGIDEFGMDRSSREILKILGKSEYTSIAKLANYSGRNEIELEEMILPAMVNPVNGEGLIRHTNHGWSLTTTGIKEAEKRNIVVTREPA